jgi:hypothetical protein
MRLITIPIVLMALISNAQAFQKFEEYRILGSEIISIKMLKQEVEDPSSFALYLKDLAEPIIFESDGFLDGCLQNIDYMIGDASQYVQIKVQTTADTMNGIMVTECVVVRM